MIFLEKIHCLLQFCEHKYASDCLSQRDNIFLAVSKSLQSNMNVCVFGYKKQDELACRSDRCDKSSLNRLLNELVDQLMSGIVCTLSFDPS